MADRRSSQVKKALSPQERRQRNREEMSTAILTAAREIMRRDGAGALNLHELARHVGLRTSSLYVYFEGKMAIYDALYVIGVRLYREAIQQTLVTLTDPWEILQAVFERYMAIAIQNPELFQLVFERPVPGFVPSESGLAELQQMTAEMEALLNRVRLENPYDRDRRLPDTHGLILTVMHGLTALHMANDPDSPVGAGRFGSLIPAAVALFKAAWG